MIEQTTSPIDFYFQCHLGASCLVFRFLVLLFFYCLVQLTASSEAKFMYFTKWMKNLIDEEEGKKPQSLSSCLLLSDIFNT